MTKKLPAQAVRRASRPLPIKKTGVVGENQTAAQAAAQTTGKAVDPRSAEEIAHDERRARLVATMMHQTSVAHTALHSLGKIEPHHEASLAIGSVRVFVPDDQEAYVAFGSGTVGLAVGMSHNHTPDELARMAGLLMAAAWAAAAYENRPATNQPTDKEVPF